jgi:hypothetical protein
VRLTALYDALIADWELAASGELPTLEQLYNIYVFIFRDIHYIFTMFKILFPIISVTASLFVAVDSMMAEPTLLIFGSRGDGRRNHSVFLGCINCDKYDSSALDNRYGEYGSRYSSTSIYNRYGEYGSRYSDTSVCNRLASNPPVVVDPDGNFYGYLTLNNSMNQTVLNPLLLGACR